MPAFNEEAWIAGSSTSCARSTPGFDVVVVDDGSTDRTVEVARPPGPTVMRLPYNLGIGGAVQTGFRYACERGFDIAVRVDGDGQHDPSELGAILAPVLAGEADIAVGSRFIGGRRLPLVARPARRHPPARADRLRVHAAARHGSDLGLPGAEPARRSGCSPPTTRTTTRRSRRS